MQKVCVNGVFSSSWMIRCGISQCSMLGHLWFTLYLGPLGDIIRKHGLPFHFYADDSELYCIVNPIISRNVLVIKCRLDSCICEIRASMLKHILQLNGYKTVFILIVSKHCIVINVPNLIVGKTEVKRNNVAMNLEGMFDTYMNIDKNMNAICKESFFHLRNLSKVCHSLITKWRFLRVSLHDWRLWLVHINMIMIHKSPRSYFGYQ